TDGVVVRNLTTGETILSASAVYDADQEGSIGSGASRSRQLVLDLPDGPRSVGQLEFTVTTDLNNEVPEFNPPAAAEDNNSAAVIRESTLAPYPDLQVAGLTTEPATGIHAGSDVVVHWQITNAGNRSAGKSWSDSVILVNTTTGEVLETANIPYDPEVLGDLAPGESRERQTTF